MRVGSHVRPKPPSTQPGLTLQEIEERLLHPAADLSSLSAREQFELITSRVADLPQAVVAPNELLDLLECSKRNRVPLRVKFGIDPTGPDIHIGHAVSLVNLRLFQRMGHQVLLVIGDFTGMIGDPSGRSDSRPALTRADIEKNMTTYEEQAAKIIDLRDRSIERHYNSEWMDRISLREWVDTLRQVSATSLLQREDFRTRLASGRGLSMAELEYALFMGRDSVVLKPDIELGGVDQYLNMHMCRDLMSNAGLRPEVIIAYNLLPGTTGERDSSDRLAKMSKSKGNYIPVQADPADMYGKVMAIPDDVMWTWFRELTEIAPHELATLKDGAAAGRFHPRDCKRLLARVVVALFNGFNRRVVQAAEQDFDGKFGKAAAVIPENIPSVRLDASSTVLESLVVITGLSRSEIRRLTDQGGIHLLAGDRSTQLTADDLRTASTALLGRAVRIGKRRFFRFPE